jgi:hypothetical protein
MIEVISRKAYVHILGQVPSILGLGGRFRQQHRSMVSPLDAWWLLNHRRKLLNHRREKPAP